MFQWMAPGVRAPLASEIISSNIAYVTLRGMYLHRCGIALTHRTQLLLTPFSYEHI